MSGASGMSAFDEISAGGGTSLGPETVALLRRLGGQVVRSSSFPPPEGHRRWSPEAVDDLLADMFAKEPTRGRVFVLACFLQAQDQASLERLILASIRNFLIDQAKSTERGKLRRRLNGIFQADGRFIRPPVSKDVPSWALLGKPVLLWQGDIGQLVEAAWRVQRRQISSWNSAGKTSAKNVEALTTVSCAVLDEADGSVREEDIARVVGNRFVLISPPVFVQLPDGRFGASAYALAVSAGEEETVSTSLTVVDEIDLDVRDSAKQIWMELSELERTLLPCLGAALGVRVAATGLGRSATQALTESLLEKLQTLFADDEDHEHVLLTLAQLGGGAR